MRSSPVISTKNKKQAKIACFLYISTKIFDFSLLILLFILENKGVFLDIKKYFVPIFVPNFLDFRFQASILLNFIKGIQKRKGADLLPPLLAYEGLIYELRKVCRWLPYTGIPILHRAERDASACAVYFNSVCRSDLVLYPLAMSSRMSRLM